MGSPSTKTIKALFAFSQNECAFPRCDDHIVDPSTKVTLGEIAHIEARNEGGPRFNGEQTEAERHGLGNLILLCEKHHKIVDADPGLYTIDVLKQMKADHETSSNSECDDDVADALRAKLVVHMQAASFGQSGGQTANVINNNLIQYGSPPRRVASSSQLQQITAMASASPGHRLELAAPAESEARALAVQIVAALKAGGWVVRGPNTMFDDQPSDGMSIRVSKTHPAVVHNDPIRIAQPLAQLASLCRQFGWTETTRVFPSQGAGAKDLFFVGTQR